MPVGTWTGCHLAIPSFPPYPARYSFLFLNALCARFLPPLALQVFQVSDQCVKLWREGWFQAQAEPAGTSTLRNPKVGAPTAGRGAGVALRGWGQRKTVYAVDTLVTPPAPHKAHGRAAQEACPGSMGAGAG